PSRSPSAAEPRLPPTATSWWGWKVPSPLPSNTLTGLLATTRSGWPSPFRSPIATEPGPLPTARFWVCWKVTGMGAASRRAGASTHPVHRSSPTARTNREPPRARGGDGGGVRGGRGAYQHLAGGVVSGGLLG